MKKLILAGVSVAAMAAASSSYAADIAPVYKAPPAFVPACAQFGGFYVGAHGAWNTHDWNWRDRDGWTGAMNGGGQFGATEESSKSGFGGGVQAGWNYQAGCTVFGIEADWTWTSLGNSKFSTDGGVGAALDTAQIDTNMKWMGTVRTRSGVVVNNLLLYVTGGLAYAKFNRTYTGIDIGVATDVFDDSSTRWGGVVGVGAEWALWNSVSLKGEVLYARFQDNESTFRSAIATAAGNNPNVRFENQDAVWSGRIGLNWRFGGGPIVARY
jgi:outer membrane immunogenic protein